MLQPFICICVLTFILCAALSSIHARAEETSAGDEIQKLIEKLGATPAFSVELLAAGMNIPETIEFKKNAAQPYDLSAFRNGAKEEKLTYGGMSFVLRSAFSTVKHPDLKLTFKIGNEADVTFYAKGMPEVVFALKYFISEQETRKWVAVHLIEPKFACPITDLKAWGELEAAKDSIEVKLDSEEAKEPLALAKAEYDSRRAELIARYSGSFLFYKPADKLTWVARKKDSVWFLSTAMSDLMYAARFTLQIESAENQKLKCVNIYGLEFFKGE